MLKSLTYLKSRAKLKGFWWSWIIQNNFLIDCVMLCDFSKCAEVARCVIKVHLLNMTMTSGSLGQMLYWLNTHLEIAWKTMNLSFHLKMSRDNFNENCRLAEKYAPHMVTHWCLSVMLSLVHHLFSKAMELTGKESFKFTLQLLHKHHSEVLFRWEFIQSTGAAW